MLQVSALNTIIHKWVAPEKVVEKFSFNKLKIEKVKFCTQSPPKIFCITAFNVGLCLASFWTFRLFLQLVIFTVSNLVASEKKWVHFSQKKLVLINLNEIFPFKICCNFSYENLF